jgi:hypothetical protein
MTQIPEDLADVFKRRRTMKFDEVLERFTHESDTGLAVLMALWVEQAMTDLLSELFVTEGHSYLEKLNGRMDDKVSLLRALGLVRRDVDVRDLRNITKIRNRFAHRVFDGTFDHPEVSALVDDLTALDDNIDMTSEGRRVHYAAVAHLCVMRLTRALFFVALLNEGKVSLADVRAAASEGYPVGPGE